MKAPKVVNISFIYILFHLVFLKNVMLHEQIETIINSELEDKHWWKNVLALVIVSCGCGFTLTEASSYRKTITSCRVCMSQTNSMCRWTSERDRTFTESQASFKLNLFCGKIQTGAFISFPHNWSIHTYKNTPYKIDIVVFDIPWSGLLCPMAGMRIKQNYYCGNRLAWSQLFRHEIMVVFYNEQVRSEYMKFAMHYTLQTNIKVSNMSHKLLLITPFVLLNEHLTRYSEIRIFHIVSKSVFTSLLIGIKPYSKVPSMMVYDGPGVRSPILKVSNRSARWRIEDRNYTIFATFSHQSYIVIQTIDNTTVFYRSRLLRDSCKSYASTSTGYGVYENTAIFIRQQKNNTSNSACYTKFGVFASQTTSRGMKYKGFPGVVILQFTFMGPQIINSMDPSQCQYGGLFIGTTSDKTTDSHLIAAECGTLYFRNIASDEQVLLILVIYYAGYTYGMIHLRTETYSCGMVHIDLTNMIRNHCIISISEKLICLSIRITRNLFNRPSCRYIRLAGKYDIPLGPLSATIADVIVPLSTIQRKCPSKMPALTHTSNISNRKICHNEVLLELLGGLFYSQIKQLALPIPIGQTQRLYHMIKSMVLILYSPFKFMNLFIGMEGSKIFSRVISETIFVTVYKPLALKVIQYTNCVICSSNLYIAKHHPKDKVIVILPISKQRGCLIKHYTFEATEQHPVTKKVYIYRWRNTQVDQLEWTTRLPSQIFKIHFGVVPFDYNSNVNCIVQMSFKKREILNRPVGDRRPDVDSKRTYTYKLHNARSDKKMNNIFM